MICVLKPSTRCLQRVLSERGGPGRTCKKVTFKLRPGVSQREPRFYQAEKTACVDALRRKARRSLKTIKGTAGAERAREKVVKGWMWDSKVRSFNCSGRWEEFWTLPSGEEKPGESVKQRRKINRNFIKVNIIQRFTAWGNSEFPISSRRLLGWSRAAKEVISKVPFKPNAN